MTKPPKEVSAALGHPPQSAVRADASAILSRLRDTLFAVGDRHLSKTFLISTSVAANLPPELHSLLSSLPDFKVPFHPFSQPGGATIALWATLCDTAMLKIFGQAALDAACRARECVSSAEGVIKEQAEGGVSRKRVDLWASAMAFARTDGWGVWKDWKWWIAGVADFAFTVSQHPTSHQTASLLFPLLFDFYLEDPLGLDRSPAHVPTYRASLADFARGFCQVFSMKGPRDTKDDTDATPWKQMVQNAIDRLLSPSIAPDELSPTSIPTLRLDVARMLIRLGDWDAATQQLDLVGAIPTLTKSVAEFRAKIESRDSGDVEGEIAGGPRISETDEETTVLLDSKTASSLQTASTASEAEGTRCDFPGCPTRSHNVKVITQRCSRCLRVWYCSKPCQEKDWRIGHRQNCTKAA